MEDPHRPPRDVLSVREVAVRAGFSYHAILRAIRRGDLQAFEPVRGRYRVAVTEYERWLHTPAQRTGAAREPFSLPQPAPRRRRIEDETTPGSRTRLDAIEAGS